MSKPIFVLPLFILVLLSLFISQGCTVIKYNEKGVVYKKYWGKQNIKDLELTKKQDGSIKIKLGQQSSTNPDAAALMKIAAEATAAAAGLMAVPIPVLKP